MMFQLEWNVHDIDANWTFDANLQPTFLMWNPGVIYKECFWMSSYAAFFVKGDELHAVRDFWNDIINSTKETLPTFLQSVDVDWLHMSEVCHLFPHLWGVLFTNILVQFLPPNMTTNWVTDGTAWANIFGIVSHGHKQWYCSSAKGHP